MVKAKSVKVFGVVGRNDSRRGLRSQSTNRNDGDGRYDLRPLATIRHRRRRRLRRQDVKTFLSEVKLEAAAKLGRQRSLIERRLRQHQQEDELALVASPLTIPSVSLKQLRSLGGGDGDGMFSGNALSYPRTERQSVVIPMPNICPNVVSTTPNIRPNEVSPMSGVQQNILSSLTTSQPEVFTVLTSNGHQLDTTEGMLAQDSFKEEDGRGDPTEY